MTLSEWLLERLAEDEAVAREAIAERTRVRFVDGHPANDPAYTDTEMWADPDAAVPCVGVGPERVLAQVAASRAIVALHGGTGIMGDYECSTVIEDDGVTEEYPGDPQDCSTIRHLASVYAAAPGYREEWKP